MWDVSLQNWAVYILLETRGPGVFSINQSRDPCRWGQGVNPGPRNSRLSRTLNTLHPPGSRGQRNEEEVYKVSPKKQHRNQQELLKAQFCLDTTADQRPSSALEKQAFMKTLQIRFHCLSRLLPRQPQVVLLPQSPTSSNHNDLWHRSYDPTLTSNRGNMKQSVDMVYRELWRERFHLTECQDTATVWGKPLPFTIFKWMQIHFRLVITFWMCCVGQIYNHPSFYWKNRWVE